ncbi:MAG: hypothetical protein ABJB93_12670 [Gaiellales bacterium]
MRLRPARGVLRVAGMQVPGCPDPDDPPLRLVSALCAAGRVARAEGLAGGGERGHELRLPGIGGRYLAGVAAHAHERGWAPVEVAALLDAVEDRSAMWIVCPSAAALRRAGLIEGGRGRVVCARWSSGGWSRIGLDVPALAAVAASGRTRGVCVAAVSGTGAPRRVVESVHAGGVYAGVLARGLAASLGVRWTVELLVATALPPGSLMALRERVASAPRCGWCGVPLLGPDCRRCQPGART